MAEEDPCLERHFKGHKDSITALDFNPNGKQLVSSSLDNTIMVWNFKQQMRAYRFVGHADQIYDVCFSPTGNFMASGSRDKTVRLWVPSIRGESTEFRAHTNTVRSVHFSPDGQQIATGSDDKTIKIWTIHRQKFPLIHFKSFQLVKIDNVMEISTFRVRCVRYSPSGKMLISCADDRTVKLHDINSSTTIHSFHELRGSPLCVTFHPSETSVAVGNSDRSVKIYDLRSRKLLQHYSSHSAGVNKLSFHPSGYILLTASSDGTLKMFDVLEGRPIYTLHGHQNGVLSCNFDSTGDYFASGGCDKQVMVWKTNFTPPEEVCKELEMTISSPSNIEKPHDVTAFINGDGENTDEEEALSNLASMNMKSDSRSAQTISNNERTKKNGSTKTPGSSDDETSVTLSSLMRTLEHMSSQITTLTQTVVLLEERVSRMENQMKTVINDK
ncbi:POC1 centriolar protein-like A [Armadillidium vulgare]|nr:POC1 centriolar protein-like A [Armadillidium vulgare]